MEKNTAPKLIDQICRLNRCSEPARFNYVIEGHPNGDSAASYCGQHINERAGMWTESPKPYKITITGPIGAK
jgi:hypothetical protein